MSDLICRLGAMSPGLDLPDLPLRLAGEEVAAIFGDASETDQGPTIRLDLDASCLAQPHLSSASPVTARQLHEALRSLLGNPIGVDRVDRVGVLYAHSYQPRPSLFGVMFDRGDLFTPPPDDPNIDFQFTSVPREGCAIFLDAVRRARPQEDDYQREVAFTTVHEIGHLFNLGHLGGARSFMASSLLPAEAPEAFFNFHEDHRQRLRLADLSPNVWPGGSNYGDLGLLTRLPTEAFFPSRDPRTVHGLQLLIDMDQKEFHAFEPVELEIEVAVAPGVDRRFRIPDAVDPGYSCFRILIDQPDGERKVYRSPRHYCGHYRWQSIAPARPFRRDLSIFAQSGGYTFQRAGVHRIRAELDLGARGVLVSDEIEVQVLPDPSHRQGDRLARSLKAPTCARILYYRDGDPTSWAVRRLEEVCQVLEGEPAAAGTRYALGRMFERAASRSPSAADAEVFHFRARHHLQRVVDHQHTSRHRREVAARLLERSASPAVAPT